MLLAQPIVANGDQTRLLFGFRIPRNSLVSRVLKLPLEYHDYFAFSVKQKKLKLPLDRKKVLLEQDAGADESILDFVKGVL